MLSRWHICRFYILIVANLIASENSEWILLLIDAGTPDYFFMLIKAICHSNLVPRLTKMIGWLYWQFTAKIAGTGKLHKIMLANLITDIWYARYRRFYMSIAAINENHNRCNEVTLGDFCWSAIPAIMDTKSPVNSIIQGGAWVVVGLGKRAVTRGKE